jgi:NAD(P)-dependent dehydrogenase (short-subunit alcohol dehydrogenase family)
LSDSRPLRKVPAPSAVLVTGASKGIGAACAIRLAADGCRVYAGVRREQDGAALVEQAGPSVVPVLLDVTDAAQIEAVARRIDDEVGDSGLRALVNNAGVAVAGPLEYLPIDELRQQLEINVTGQIAVTQALLPLLRRARTSRPDDPAAGRILFMSSVAGRSALPFMGAYAASKFALEAAADALRLELAPFRLAVILIEPGVIATPIWETSRARAARNIERMPPQLTQYYGRALDALRERAGTGGLPPERVADVVARALAARRPRARYVVGRDARIRILIQQLLPDAVRDRLIGAALRRFTRTD